MINKSFLAIIGAAVLGLVLNTSQICVAQSRAQVRQQINIDRDWKFIRGDQAGAEVVAYNDQNWNNINIPHNFSEPYFQSEKWYTGYGWYRKHFAVPVNWKSKRLFIEFEGAFREADVFVNGKKVGEHESGYTGFSIDISAAVKDGDNILAVRLTNRWNPQLTPRDGDHNFTGGIYRDVYLVITNPSHITWFGTFVTTPKLNKQSGTVNVKTEVANDGVTAKTYHLKSVIIDSLGRTVDSFSSQLKIEPGKTGSFDQTGGMIKSPKLWAPQHPHLYKVISTLYEGRRIVDFYTTEFGFRWMEWTADKGFFLNGEHYYFKGANVHQDHAGWASAVTNAGIARDVQMVKDAGFDFIRGSHYPHDPAFAEACDRKGVLFWSENTFWGCGGYSQEGGWGYANGAYPVKTEDRAHFEASVKNSLKEMIRVNRNHPSIITWSMSNEPFFTEKSTLPRVREFLKELTAYSHELDPSRKVAIGGSQRGDIDTIADRPGKYEPGFGDIASQPQFDWRSGQAIWCAFDYGTHAGRGTLGRMGIIDYYRIPKRAWYWYRNEYLKIPPPVWAQEGVPAGLQLSTDKTIIEHANGTDDVQIMVTVVDSSGAPLNNSPDVTFELISGPGEFPTGSVTKFSDRSDIAIRDGKAAIEFRTYFAGKSVIKASSAGLKDAFITITSLGAPAYVKGKSRVVTERPYTRFIDVEKTERPVQRINYAFNKPTHASSEAPAHSGRYANDQDTATYWMANTSHAGEWLKIDMENSVTLAMVKISFTKPGLYKYKIQVSADDITWKDAMDMSANTDIFQTKNLQIPSGFTGRSLRILFVDNADGSKIALREIEIYGRN